VYLQLACEGGFGGLIVKNISRAPLNMPVEELTQRFVRGAMARTGEGSGLGLSIAESLCKVQGGRFDIRVDGDLFKAAVWLPLAG
jgi:signal transduction histidine kinase